MRKIVFTNQKGGTGKTTTAVTVGAALALKGKKTLLVDMDPQGNIGHWFGVSPQKTLYHVLVEEAEPLQCIQEIRENLHLISGNKTLAQAEIILSSRSGRENVLSRAMENVNGYDYVLLDCAPSLSLLNLNSLTYSNEAVIPVSMDYFSLIGVREAMDNMKMVRERLGHPIKLSLIVPTFFDKRNRKSFETVETLEKNFPGAVSGPIRISVKMSEAVSYREDIFAFAPKSGIAGDYKLLVERIDNA
ncbi:MAG: ParA family protein [Nitrospinae bacterium]|nr:ParA family protein [Nitrospinota bacterium]